jgi:hypothetical protein
MNTPSIIKREYVNGDFRWWNPRSWYSNTTYEHDTMCPIHIRVRGTRINIYADSFGHELVKYSRMEKLNK